MSNWSQLECELIVQDYMSMFELEMRGEKYSKAEHRRNLMFKLDQRSKGSVEFKHQNISAVLVDSGYPYIRGYKPANNYQALLKNVVETYLNLNEKNVIDQAEKFIASDYDVPVISDWVNVLTDAPDRQPIDIAMSVRQFNPKKYNYAEREANNSKLGKSGEEFVLEYEHNRLVHAGRDDLAREIEWTSKEKGDGVGYDIKSFNEKKDRELFIEVKTTNSGKHQPFFITDNEVAFSEMYSEKYSLYRVYQFRDTPKLFLLPGNVAGNVHLKAKTFRASF